MSEGKTVHTHWLASWADPLGTRTFRWSEGSRDFLRSSVTKNSSAVIVNLLGLVMPLAMLQVYDRIIPSESTVTLTAVVLILILTTVLEAILRIARIYVDNFDAAKFSHNVLVDAFGRLLHPHASDIGLTTPRKAIDRLEAIARLGSFIGGPARQIAIDLPFSLIYFITIAIVGGWLVLVPLAIALVFGLFTFVFGSTLEEAVEQKDGQDTRVFDFVGQVLGGISTVKGLSTERLMMRRFERLGKKTARNTFNLVFAADRTQVMANSLGNVTTLSVVTVGAILAVEGTLTIGTLAACSLLAGRAVQPTLRLAGIWNEYQRTKLTMREASRIFELPALREEKASRHLKNAPEIRFSQVSFSLDPQGRTFQLGDLTIAPNSIVSLCGSNGSGKSSILKLIAGLREPDIGCVKINGMEASSYRCNFSNAIGIVSPESTIFHGTIIENLTLFGTGCGQEDALNVCDFLGLEDEIYKFPAGYSTELGGAAVESLPKGFIQRLILARAIAQRPKVLLLDEAHAFLDPTSDLKLRECLKDLQLSSTIIQVTNRPEHLALSHQNYDVTQAGILLPLPPLSGRAR